MKLSYQGRNPVSVGKRTEYLPGIDEGGGFDVSSFSGETYVWSERRRGIRMFGWFIPLGRWQPAL